MDKELIKSLSDLLDEKLTPIKNDLKNIKSQQEESISILRALEHKADINKAEHDKLFNDIANLSGSVGNISYNLRRLCIKFTEDYAHFVHQPIKIAFMISIIHPTLF